MQKVACPTMIVQIEKVMPLKLKAALSAIPVMIPGRASGNMKRRLTASRPKKAERWIANAAHEPRTNATAVATSPACTDRSRAERTLGSSQVAVNHFSVRPGIGQLSMLDVLNAEKKSRSIGLKRKMRIRAAQILSASLAK